MFQKTLFFSRQIHHRKFDRIRHIYKPRPFIFAYNQVSVILHSKVKAFTMTDGQTVRRKDGRTDGHSKSVGPKFGFEA